MQIAISGLALAAAGLGGYVVRSLLETGVSGLWLALYVALT